MISLLFCQSVLTASRPVLRGYPADAQTPGEHLRRRRMDLGLTEGAVAE
jgi:hypothetical protein